tara:strand:+ start:1382 stop:1510 length:129 start_codon:yes stop_codon:yes gene_type:complete
MGVAHDGARRPSGEIGASGDDDVAHDEPAAGVPLAFALRRGG